MPTFMTRRHMLAGLPALVAGFRASSAAAEPPPEVSRVRLPVFANLSDCQTPLYLSEELLYAEGITEVHWVGLGGSDDNLVSAGTGPDSSDWISHGEIDFDWNFPPAHLRLIANGTPIKVVAGMHAGCLELFANDTIQSIGDLKGKRVGVDALMGIPHLMLIVIAASVGLDPAKDIDWFNAPDFNPVELFAEGKIDAFLAGPPLPQEMLTRKLGHVILNTGTDKPWSQYFCCMMSSTADFIDRNPIATKRILRAVLKSVDFCISDPEKAARAVVERGFASRYDYALQAMSQGRYDTWREYDPADSLRFWGLRMQETGIVNEGPNKIIADGTDWRFLEELKREMKS